MFAFDHSWMGRKIAARMYGRDYPLIPCTSAQTAASGGFPPDRFLADHAIKRRPNDRISGERGGRLQQYGGN
jgi:hypothetical protein